MKKLTMPRRGYHAFLHFLLSKFISAFRLADNNRNTF